MTAPNGGALGMRTSEAAGYLGVSVGSLRRWSDLGYLPCSRTPGGARRFRPEDLAALAQDGRTGALGALSPATQTTVLRGGRRVKRRRRLR